AGAMSGAFFETFVMAEILKSYYNAGILEPSIYYYRDKDGKEIDVIIEENGTLHPIEIKKTSNPGKEHIENFTVLDKVKDINVGTGCIISMYVNIIHINEKNISIPVAWI
ncbi:MAG: DUF4143 domain-containing protein, partial [Bacteroidales bacterium]